MTGDVRICNWCSSKFISKQYAQKYCSSKCGIKGQNKKNWERRKKPRKATNCKRCDKDLSHKKAHAIYCSQSCKCMDFNFNNRSKTRTQSLSRRMEIIERDKSICYMCGKILSKKEVQLDHLIPVALGGTSDPTNIAVSCGFCNKSRGIRMGVQQKRKIEAIKK